MAVIDVNTHYEWRRADTPLCCQFGNRDTEVHGEEEGEVNARENETFRSEAGAGAEAEAGAQSGTEA
jgi:hypothetical protein